VLAIGDEVFRFCGRVMVLWLESVAADLCTNILIPQGKRKMLERAEPTMTTFNKLLLTTECNSYFTTTGVLGHMSRSLSLYLSIYIYWLNIYIVFTLVGSSICTLLVIHF
jgi:hypothetical protein